MNSVPCMLPLTSAQTDVWFDERLSSRSLAYSMADYLDIRGPLDLDGLERALRGLLEEAQCAQARFVETDTGPMVSVEPIGRLPLRRVDLRGRTDPAGDAVRAMWADLDEPFDIAGHPLLRLIVFQVAEERTLCYLAMHHLLCDGYSRLAMYGRLSELYRGQEGTALAPLRILADTEAAYLQSPRAEIDRRFWQEELAVPAEPLSLSDRPPAAATTLLRRTRVLDEINAKQLRSGAAAAQSTWGTFVIAAAAAYLGRMTGRTDVLLTLPVTARVDPRTRAVPGMIANYLPLRVTVRPQETVGQLRSAVAHKVMRILKHQRYPVQRIRRDAGTRADDRRPFGPFINVLPQQPTIDLGECTATLHNLSTGIVDDLMITVLEGAGGTMELHLNANPDRYGEAELDGHLDRFTAFLEEYANADPDTAVGRLRLLTETESRQLDRWQGAQVPAGYPDVVERIRALAAADPQAVALVDPAGPVGYQDLIGRASALSRGLAPGTVVGILARPGREFVTGVLAALGAGAAWLPLDVRAPDARSAALLQDAGAHALLADQEHHELAGRLAAQLPGAGPATLIDERCDPPDRLAPVLGRADDLAYVIFTSGSTGRPKGAMVHRAGMLNHLLAKIEDLDLGAGDGVVQNAPLTFDVSVWQMLAPLLVGGYTRVVSAQTAADPQELFGIVRDESIPVLEVVPSLLRAALDLWDAGLPAPQVEGTLRWLMVTGEAMPPDLCARWFARRPGIPLLNAYGPTECSDDVTHAVLRAGDQPDRRTPIGRAVRNTLLYVLDDGLQPVPVGVPGELYVGGAGVGRGYLGDPRKTAAAFPPDPFAAAGGRAGARMYRTGDRVVRRPDGQLEFLERLDHQVKVRGHRIELGEVEAVLRGLPQVADAIVVAGKDRNAGTRLVAYLVGGADLDTVRAQMSALVPEYMVPAVLIPLAALPLTAHGKVDRAALPDPGSVSAVSAASSAGTSPASTAAAATIASAAPERSAGSRAQGTQETLCALFADILGLDSVAPTDSFFALGGDSISSIQLVSRARREGVVLTPRQVFEEKTPVALAAAAGTVDGSDQRSDRSRGADEGAAEDGGGAGIGEFALTPIAAQLAEDCADLGGPAGQFSQYVLIRTPAGLRPQQLAELLQAVVDRHDALRLQLAQHLPGAWTARIAPVGSVTAAQLLTTLDARDAADDPDSFNRLVDSHLDQARARLDPVAGLVLQAVLFDCGPQRPGRLLTVVHHLAVDGVSWRILIGDLEAAWTALAAGRPAALDPVPTSYRRWSAILHRQAHSARRVGELPFWLEHSGADQAGQLGSRPLDPARDTYATAGRLRLELDPKTTTALLTTVPALYHAEVNDVLLTALVLAVADWQERTGPAAGSGTRPGRAPGAPRRIEIELEGHGREDIEPGVDLSRTIGWFTSVYPVALRTGALDWAELWAGGPALGALLRQVKEQLRALPDHGVGYGLLRYLNPQAAARLGSGGPQLGFNYLGRFATGGGPDAGPAAETPWSLDGRESVVGTGVRPDMPLRHVLAVTPVTEDRADGPHLTADWQWAAGALDPERARDLAETWFRALAALAEHAGRPGAGGHTPSDLPLVSVEQRELDQWEQDPAVRAAGGLADVLPLTAIQRGLLFQAEFDPEPTGLYTLQIDALLAGKLDPTAFRNALTKLVYRHAALRTAFVHRPAGDPVALVYQRPQVELRQIDLRGRSPRRQKRELEQIAEQDRSAPFDLRRPPLMRCTLVQLSPQRHRYIWSLHHILLDGWSMPILVRDLLALYHAPDAQLPPTPSGRAYPRWIAAQDHDTARQAWHGALAGLSGPTFLAPDPGPAGASSSGRARESVRLDLGQARTEALAELARRRDLTMNTLIQACWGLLLSRLTGTGDVLFGAVVSTRPADLPGAESTVGMFLNTLPVRVAVDPAERPAAFFERLQRDTSALRRHDHLGLGEMLRGNPALAAVGEPFDTAVLYENFPALAAQPGRAPAPRIRDVRVRDSRHYPLSLVAEPGQSLELRLDFAPDRLPRDWVQAAGRALTALLDRVGQDADGTVGGLLHALAQAPQPLRAPAGGSSAPSRPTGDPAAEQALCQVFGQILGRDVVGPQENFFTLGGDSISAIQVVAGAQRAGFRISVRDVFQGRTPAAIASVCAGPAEPPPAAPAAAGAALAALVNLSEDEMDELDADLEP